MYKCHMTFDSYLMDRFGMNEAQFRNMLQEHMASYHFDAERPDAVIECYKKKYRHEFDCWSVENMELDFADWWEIYYPDLVNFHELCDSTGTTPRDETIAYEWFQKRWEQRDNLIKLGQCPF